MPQPWSLPPQIEPSAELLASVGGHPLVARLLAQRGIATPEAARVFMDPASYSPAPPTALFGVERAARLLKRAIEADDHILIWGDFDVDGQTSTSLLVDALRKLAGRDRVHYHVPNRFSEGHGIRLEKLQSVLAGLPPIGLLLTCDTGIGEGPAIGHAKEQGLTVVVTDHHDLTAEFLPLTPGVDPLWGRPASEVGAESVRRADAIVNPKFQPADDPLRTLPGVGVVYKLIEHLFAQMGRGGEEAELLDLVALGIVADVAEQVHDARYLLQLGLDRLRNTRRIGLKALMDNAGLDPAKVDAESIGFQLGPRMNALGRLEDATVAVELLTTDDALRAGELAARMGRLNQERRILTSQITGAALEMIARNPKLLSFNALVLAHPAWHAGIVGIVASRLVETFGLPAVLLLTPPGEAARGSARSVAGVDIGASIAACSHLLIDHGGHPGAAGLSLPAEKIDAFRRELSRQIEAHRIPDAPVGLRIDAEAALDELDLHVAEEIQRLAPFGNGNPTPQFMSRGLTIVNQRRMGKEGSHRRLTVAAPGREQQHQQVVWFNSGEAETPVGPVDLVYTLSINEYRGARTLQLMYVDMRAAVRDEDDAVAIGPAEGDLRVHDLRGRPVAVADLPGWDAAQWYAEGVALPIEASGPGQVAYAPRTRIAPDPTRPLVIWTAPPSPALLHWLVATSGATEIYLADQPTTDDSLDGMLRQVAGLCKYALGRDGLLDVEAMAARLGASEPVIERSLLWLEQRGLITLLEWGPDESPADGVRIAPGDGARDDGEAELVQARLYEELAEMRARRRYYRRATLGQLGIGQKSDRRTANMARGGQGAG